MRMAMRDSLRHLLQSAVITVTDGGAVTNGGSGFIGRASTNVGTVNVGGTGALATWDVGADMFIAGNSSLCTVVEQKLCHFRPNRK